MYVVVNIFLLLLNTCSRTGLILIFHAFMQYERSATILQIFQEAQVCFRDLKNGGRAFILHERTKNKNQTLNMRIQKLGHTKDF